jgi:hypothetical protein
MPAPLNPKTSIADLSNFRIALIRVIRAARRMRKRVFNLLQIRRLTEALFFQEVEEHEETKARLDANDAFLKGPQAHVLPSVPWITHHPGIQTIPTLFHRSFRL